MSKLDLDFVHLTAAELDDQALAEITALLAQRSTLFSASRLIRLAATGDLVVARRPCGFVPEIVGMAARTQEGEAAGQVLIAVDEQESSSRIRRTLKQELDTTPGGTSLFRRRDRAPLGMLSAPS